MADMREIRRKNLRRLVNQHRGMNNLARKLGLVRGAYISQLLTNPPHRELSEKTARKWERKLLLPPGWLDRGDSPLLPAGAASMVFDHALLEQVVGGVLSELEAQDVKLRPARLAEFIVMQYDDAKAFGTFDPVRLKKMVGLIKR